jgi:hypothetical protein
MSPNPSPRPLALTDDQKTALLRASAPLDRDLREPFLHAVARALQGREPLGDGEVFRTIREVQREFWHPPLGTEWPVRQHPARLTKAARKIRGVFASANLRKAE